LTPLDQPGKSRYIGVWLRGSTRQGTTAPAKRAPLVHSARLPPPNNSLMLTQLAGK